MNSSSGDILVKTESCLFDENVELKNLVTTNELLSYSSGDMVKSEDDSALNTQFDVKSEIEEDEIDLEEMLSNGGEFCANAVVECSEEKIKGDEQFCEDVCDPLNISSIKIDDPLKGYNEKLKDDKTIKIEDIFINACVDHGLDTNLLEYKNGSFIHSEIDIKLETEDEGFETQICGTSDSITQSEHSILEKHVAVIDERNRPEDVLPGASAKIKQDFLSTNHKNLIEITQKDKKKKMHRCGVCNKKFTKKGSLNDHTRIHKGDRPFKCELCGKLFIQKVHLNHHKLIHTGEKPYECEVCQRSFTISSSLVNHKRIHTGEKPYGCEICHKNFRIKKNLVEHERTHSGEKPYECEICFKTFALKKTLVEHSRVHTGGKPYECEICYETFAIRKTLVTHNRIHTGEKPYECQVCQKTFAAKTNLVTHQRMHTGERPYECQVCHKSFAQKSNLNRHKCKQDKKQF